MLRSFVSLAFILLCLYGLEANSDPISSNGHSIKKLKIAIKPKAVSAGSKVKLFSISFKLKSKTGISKNRIKVLVNDKALSIDGSAIELTKSELSEDDIDIYNADINLKDITFNDTENEIKVQYLLSSISPETIKAQDSRTIFIQQSANNGGGNNNGSGGGTDPNNGSVHQAPRLISILAEVVNGDGMVSAIPKKIRLTVDHEQKLLDIVNKENFNPKTNIVLKNLKITSISPSEEKTNISNGIIFDLETASAQIDSAAVSKNGQMLRTIYLSESILLNKIEKLRFRVNLDKFYENSGIKLEEDLVTNASDNINIKGNSATILTEPSFDDPIVFNLSNFTKSKATYTSNLVNLRAGFSYNNGGIASIRSTNFSRTKKNGNKINPSLQNKKHKLKLNVTNGSASLINIDNNSATLSVPVSFSITANKKSIEDGGFLDATLAKTIRIPFLMIGKTSDNLDLLLENTLNKESLIIFNGSI